jgi:hypothetical protein
LIIRAAAGGVNRWKHVAGQDFGEYFCWGSIVEDTPGSVVEFAGDGVEVGLVVGDVDAFGRLCVCQAAGWGVVESCLADSGSDLSKELVVGVEPAALDFRVAPGCPPGPVAMRRSSAVMPAARA